MARRTPTARNGASARTTGPQRLTPVVQITMPEGLIREVDAWAREQTERRYGRRVSRSEAIRELCAMALRSPGAVHVGSGTSTGPEGGSVDRVSDRAAVSVKTYRLGDEPEMDQETARLSPAERVAMMGELALTAYELGGRNVASGIRRDVVRVVRGRR